MRRVARAAAPGVLSALLAITVVLAAAPAHATVEKDGNHTCTSIYKGSGIQSLGSGTVRHYLPSGTLRASWFNSGLQTRTNVTSFLGTFSWKVTATNTLSSPGTFAFCEPH